MSLEAYLSWLMGVARDGEVSYLPHRRETAEQLGAVAKVPGVRLVATGLPIELVLAGAEGPLDILTLPSSAVTTLALVLGPGVTINGNRLPSRTKGSARA
jgi:hypothetical protein